MLSTLGSNRHSRRQNGHTRHEGAAARGPRDARRPLWSFGSARASSPDRAEPPWGVEPQTYALRGCRSGSLRALPAPRAPLTALTAPRNLGERDPSCQNSCQRPRRQDRSGRGGERRIRYAYLMCGSELPAIFTSRLEETADPANRFAGAIPANVPSAQWTRATASVMTVTAVGSSRPSRFNRRHVQKSRASRTSGGCARPSAVGGQRCGELVGELVEAGVGGAIQELVEGGDPARSRWTHSRKPRRERR